MFKHIKQMHYKELFLYGSLLSYLLGMVLTIFFGLYTQMYLTIVVACLSALVIVVAIYYYRKYGDYISASLILLWNSVFFVTFRIVYYHYSLDVVFLLIPPMVASILLDKKTLLFHGTLYIVFCFFLLGYGYSMYPEHIFLHNRSLMIVFIIFSFFIVTFGLVYHYSIEQSYKKLEKSDKEKGFLLHEVHHRVKNNLNMITSILGLQEQKNSSEEMKRFIHNNILRINSIGLVHDLLNKEESVRHINLEKYIYDLTHYIVTISKKEHLYIIIEVDDIVLNFNDVIHIGIIINELMSNTIKYGLHEEKDYVHISLTKQEGEYLLKYEDSNKNGTLEPMNKKGFGMELIALSVEHIEGRVETKKEDCFSYFIYFKGSA